MAQANIRPHIEDDCYQLNIEHYVRTYKRLEVLQSHFLPVKANDGIGKLLTDLKDTPVCRILPSGER